MPLPLDITKVNENVTVGFDDPYISEAIHYYLWVIFLQCINIPNYLIVQYLIKLLLVLRVLWGNLRQILCILFTPLL